MKNLKLHSNSLECRGCACDAFGNVVDYGVSVLERIAFADGTSRICEYFWGNDLSGTEQGAGGVGGLIAVSIDGTFFTPCYDHKGNIVCYVSETGAIVGQYVYDPYGNVIEHYGTMPNQFNFGFSTKYFDREVDLVGYQYRFLRPSLGRWLNRDPIGEDGGENLYVFCMNDPVCRIDLMGCGTWEFGIPSPVGNYPEFSVSYELDSKERKCCHGLKVFRYVRKFLTGGQIGPYVLDGTTDQFVSGYPIAYAPDDWPEGPGVGWWTTVIYRFAWSWDFSFEAICTKGPWAGKILSTQKKLYWADGHKAGDESFRHGFMDVPKFWLDLTVPSSLLD